MPLWRKLHVKLIDSDDVNEMPDYFIKYLWLLLFLILDKEGRGKFKAGWVKGRALPEDNHATLEMVQEAIEYFRDHKMIRVYEVDGKNYFDVPTWHDYQNTDREGPSVLPPYSDEAHELFMSHSGLTHESLMSHVNEKRLSRVEKEKEKEEEKDTEKDKNQGGHTNTIQGSSEINEFPEHPLSKAFVKAFSILPHDLKKWDEACKELTRMMITEEEIGITKLLMDERKLSYSGPWSIIKTAVYVHAQHIKRGPIFTQKVMEPEEIKTLARDLINFQKGQKTDGHNISQGSP